MQAFTTSRAILRRFRWELGILCLFLSVAACSEVPVDPDTANITKRPKDTVLRIDTTMLRDTVVKVDTVVHGADTLYEHDTLVQVRTVIRRVEIIVKDTLVINDTTFVVKHEIVVDTLRELSPELVREGRLFRLGDGGAPLESVPVEMDDLTRIVVVLKPGVGPTAIRLKAIGRITAVLDSVKWGVTPVWFYLLVPHTEIKSGVAVRELYGDPRNNQTVPGMAMIPRLPYNPVWVSTEQPASGDNVFRVTKVDTVNRRIYCSAKARFKKVTGRVDSLALTLGY